MEDIWRLVERVVHSAFSDDERAFVKMAFKVIDFKLVMIPKALAFWCLYTF